MLRSAALFTGLISTMTASLGQRSGDPIAPVVDCLRTSTFSILEVGRLPPSVTARTVQTLAGARPVSLVDGYRVILGTSQGKPFINLKVELSATERAKDDRDAVLAQMQMFAGSAGPQATPLSRTTVGGVEILALNQPSLEARGPLAFYSLFLAQRSAIATLYFLNQEPSVRAFATYGEYEKLRDEGTEIARSCLEALGG